MQVAPDKNDILSGQAVYSEKFLRIYDWLVTKFSNRFVWHCPWQILTDHFKKTISQNHLDIDVGTGYFFQKLKLTPGSLRLGLLDLNQNCLTVTANNLKALQPEIYCHDVFEPFTSITKKFDSVSLNYVLHCIPGTFS